MMEYGLIGEKLKHSFSKEIHGSIGKYDYHLTEIPPSDLSTFLSEKEFKAVNVTIPYKHQVIPFLDEISPAAKAIGAVNCIRNDDGRLIGHNTDFDGLLAVLNRTCKEPAGKKILILGTGGTSDTAYAVCKSVNAGEIIKVSRRKAEQSPGVKTVTYEEAIKHHADSEIIINTTPSGMYPDVFSKPIDISVFRELKAVVDVIYNPIRTKLVAQAKELGIEAEGGLYMLVAQAVRASEFFFSTKYEDSLIDEIYKKISAGKTNIVLTGMPASGKTTISNILSGALGRELIDTDELIEKKEKMSISEIFQRYGEKYFRDAESEAVKEASSRSGIIIATGGGAILRKENIDNLKLNGTICFINRNPEDLIPTKERPTAFNRTEMEKRYKERYSIYVSTADHIIKNNSSAEDAAEKIMEILK